MTEAPPAPRRRGRPAKSQDEKHVTMAISVTPADAARLRADPDGVSGAIARLLREDEARNA